MTVDRVGNNDTIACDIEWLPDNPPADDTDKNAREKKLVSGLKSMLGIVVEVHLVAPKTIPRSEGKAVRVIDKRALFEESQFTK